MAGRKRLASFCDLSSSFSDLAFKKYPGILEQESRHDVAIGPVYLSDTSAQLFTHYIAQSQREPFLKFFSGKLEDELIVVLHC